jgi:predicted RNA-binding protein with PUA-like domain
MARWLVKEEPTHYSYADLARDRTTTWNGVHNALALRHLKSMRPGDEVL